MKKLGGSSIWLALLVAGASAQGSPETAAGIALYPGSSKAGVEASEKLLRDSGYAQATCRRTADSLAKVVAHYRKDKRLQLVGEPGPGDDNATLSGPAGASIVINSPWMDVSTLQSRKDTLICIASRGAR